MMMHKNKTTNKSKRGIFLGRYNSMGDLGFYAIFCTIRYTQKAKCA
jgi:hypothetical protein